MLLAKAKNMNLVILLRYKGMTLWEISPNAYPPNNDRTKAFICHPKHQEACLKCLNHRPIQTRKGDDEWSDTELVGEWNPEEWYMSENYESRITPA